MSRDIRSEVKSYYELGWEKDRLKTGKGHAHAIEGDVEKTRTIELLLRFLPKPKATILDVGGAAGAYAFWLAELGYEVHLVDLTPLHIEQAQAEQQKKGSAELASCKVGDACNLDFPDNFADVILCMGPLYHLPDIEDRKRCLSESWRVLRPGGLLFAVGISRFASLLDFLRIGDFNDEDIAAMIEQDLSSGCHVNPAKNPRLFTTAFLHKPEHLYKEISGSGFNNVAIMAIEGPILYTKDLESHWVNEQSKARLLAFAKQVENQSSIMGMSNHIAGVGYKPLII